MQCLPDRRELRRADEECRVHLAVLQCMKGFEIDQWNQPGVEARDVVGSEQRLGEGSRPASRRADGHPLVAELVELRQRPGIAVEDPQRFVVEGHQHDQVAALLRADNPTVHEGDIHAGFRIVQKLLVFVCATGQPLFDGHPVARQDLLVALRVLVVEPVLESGGEHDVPRNRALQEPGAQESHERQRGDRPKPVQHPTTGRPVFIIESQFGFPLVWEPRADPLFVLPRAWPEAAAAAMSRSGQGCRCRI